MKNEGKKDSIFSNRTVLIRALIKRNNRPIVIHLEDVKRIAGDYPPFIVGQTITTTIFYIRRLEGRSCLIWLNIKLYTFFKSCLTIKKERMEVYGMLYL